MSRKKTPKTRHGRRPGKVALSFAANLVLLIALLGAEVSPWSRPAWWESAYPVAMSILTGGLVSFFFYWLVVYVPDQRKRRIIKNNLAQTYRRIKEDILYQVVFASIKGGRRDLHADTDTIECLMTTDGFRAAFKGGREADEGFYAFENQMSDDTPEFRQIILNLELLAKQIEFVLHNYTMDDERLFSYFKGLETMLLALRHSSPGYDDSKPLCRFVYELFMGWNWIEGDIGYDVIEKMIDDI